MLPEKHIKNDWRKFYDFCENRLKGVSTGIDVLDKQLLGLRGIVCIRGAPKTNKSTLTLQMAKHYAETHGPVLFYDRENGINRLRLRLLCQELPSSEIDLVCRLREKDQTLNPAIHKVCGLPFYVLFDEEISDIKALINEAIQEYKKPILLVVDSLQKLRMNLQERRNSIDRWLCDLDELKVEYEHKLRIIFTSEKNYANYTNPQLGGSKDSSEVEYSAECILDLRRDPESDRIICHVAADRDGPDGEDIYLRKVLTDLSNPRSFCYRLEGAEDEFCL